MGMMAETIAGTITYNNPQAGSIAPFGTDIGGSTQTYGVLVEAPSGGMVKLTDFTLYFSGTGTIPYQADVYAWEGSYATGPDLFSTNTSMTGNGSMQPVTTTIPGGVSLTPGATYALFFTTSDPTSIALSTGVGGWLCGTAENSLPDGEDGGFIWDNNAANYSYLFDVSWDNPGTRGVNCALIANFNQDPAPITTVTRTAGSSPSTYGSPVTFQAFVSPDPGDGSAITFYTNAVACGTATTTSGVASLTETNWAYSGGSAYTVTATFAGNPDFATSTGTLTGGQQVNQASLGITANDDAKIYGATKLYGPGSTAFTSVGLQNGETIGSVTLASSGAAATAGATSYALTPSAATGGTFNSVNYNIGYNNGTLVVQPSPLTVTASNQTVVYGASFPAFTGSLVGVTNNDNLTVTFYPVAGAHSGAGTYGILPVFNDPNGVLANYSVTTNAGSLLIQPAPLGVTANDQTRIYGTNVPFTVTYTGLAPWDTAANLATAPVAASVATVASTIGQYQITVSGGASPNYSFSYTNGTLTITKAPLLVVGANASRPYGATNPVFTAAISGIMNGNNISARFSTTATTNSLPGNYLIQLSMNDPGVKLGQYDTTLNSGILTITNALLTGTVQSVARQYGQTNPVFDVVYSGFVNNEGTNLLTGDLTFICDDANEVAVDTNSPVGAYSIEVTNGPTAPNYTLEFVEGTLSVTQAVLTVTASDAQKVYGSTNPLFAATIAGYLNNDNSNVLSGTLAFTNAAGVTSFVGNYPISLGGWTATNYALNFVSGNLQVTPAPLAVTGNNANRLYGQSNPALTGVVVGLLNNDDLGISYQTAATPASTVGTYDIVPAFADPLGRLQNYSVSSTNGVLSVSATPLAVTANNTNRLYGQSNPAFTGSLLGVVNGDNITASYGSAATAASAVGTYTIVPALIDPSGKLGNYSVSSTNGTLTVGNATLVVTAVSQTRNYGQANAPFTVSYNGLVNGQDASVVSGTPTFACLDGSGQAVGPATPVGAYAITPGGLSAANYTLSYSNGSLTIDPTALTVTANALSRTYGATNPVLTASYTGFVNSEGTNVLSGQPALTTLAGLTSPVGGYGITAAQGTLSATNYSFNFINGILTVTAAPLTGQVQSFARAYGQTNPVFGVTYSGFVNSQDSSVVTGPIAYTCLDSNAVPVDTNTWVGSYAIQVATPQTAANYSITYTPGYLSVTQAVLITSADPQSRLYGTTNPVLTYTLSGFANGEGTNVVSGEADLTTTAAVGSPVGPYPIVIGLGTLSATNYSFSLTNGVLTVGKAILTVAADSQTRLYGQTNSVFTVEYSGFVDGDGTNVLSGSPALSSVAVTNTGVGQYPIVTALGTLSAGNYALNLVNGTLTINPTALSVVADNVTRQYGTANPAFAVTYTGFVNAESSNVLSGTLAVTSATDATTGVGVYDIVPAGATSTNYTITFTDGTLSITQAPLSVVVNSTNRLYGQTNPVFTGTLTGTLNSDNLGVSFVTAATSGSAAGTYGIIPAFADPANLLQNYLITTNPGVLTISPVSLTVTADNQFRAYGQANPAFTLEYNGFVNGDSASALAVAPTGSTVADPTYPSAQYPITVGGGGSPNYTFTYVSGTLTVTQAVLNVVGNYAARAYGQTNPVFTATMTGLVNSDDITVSASTQATPASPAGNYIIYLVINDPLGELGNYNLSVISATLSVTNALVVATVDNQSRLYGQANPPFTVEYSGWMNGQGTNLLAGNLSFSCLDAQGHAVRTNTPVGSYTINASGLSAPNYSILYVPGALAVNPTPLTVTAVNASRTYGATNPIFAAAFSAFVNGENSNVLSGTLAVGTAATPASPTGSYPIVPSGLTSGNYSLTFVNGTLAVTAAPLAGQVQSFARAYGQTNPVFGVTYSGFVNNQDSSVVTGPIAYSCLDSNAVAVDTNTWVGSYAIQSTTAQTAPNYAITYSPGSLTVTQAVLIASADPQNRLYGTTNPVLTYTLSGFVNADGTNVVAGEPVLSTAATNDSAVGQYPIVIGLGTLSATNYAFSLTNGLLTVSKATLTVTADNQTRLYGQTNPVFTVEYSGFVDGDGTNVLSGSPALSSVAATNTGVGQYPIVTAPGTLSATNYALNLVNGSLTINPTALSIVANDVTRQYGTANPAFAATYTGFVNDESNNVLGGTLAVTSATDATTGVGTYDIVPAGVTAANYTITFTDGTLTITQAVLTVTANNVTRPYGQPNPAFTGTVVGLYNQDAITASYTCAAAPGSQTGTYPIVPSLVDPDNLAGNYNVTYVPGTLTVTVALDNSTATNVLGYYVVGDLPAQINTNASVADGGSLSFNNGTLTVAIVTNLTAQDELSVATQGNGAGEIDLQNNTLTYGGVGFASLSGGAGQEPLQFVFNTNATPASITELMRQITFYTSNTNTALRALTFTLAVGGEIVVSGETLILDRPPVAGDCTLSAAQGATIRIPVSLILSNDLDVDGDTLAITDYSDLSANGAWVTNTGASLTYTPRPGTNTDDLFAYVVSDGRGGSTVGIITINLVRPNELGIELNRPAGKVNLTLAAFPGAVCEIQASSDLVNWVNLYSVTADSLGMIQIQDASATNQVRRFYRVTPQ